MDWKFGATILAVAAVLITAFFAGGVSMPSVGTGGVSGFFTAASANAAKNVTVDTVLDAASFSIDTGASLVEVELLAPSSDITIGGSLMDLSSRPSVKLKLVGWKGKITVNGSLSLDGTAREVDVDGIKMTSTGGESKLVFKEMGFSTLGISEVSLSSLKFQDADGYVYIDGGKTTVRLDGEPVEFGSFFGSIDAGTSLRLGGTVRSLSVSGENKIRVE